MRGDAARIIERTMSRTALQTVLLNATPQHAETDWSQLQAAGGALYNSWLLASVCVGDDSVLADKARLDQHFPPIAWSELLRGSAHRDVRLEETTRAVIVSEADREQFVLIELIHR
jgi:hypothetical protein